MTDPELLPAAMPAGVVDEQPPSVDERQKAFRRAAMDSLARREHSRHELIRKLQAKGATAEEATLAIDRLAAENLQSDARFVEATVRYQRSRGKGPQWIRQWLRDKGIGGELLAGALADDPEAWLAEACAVRERRFGSGLPQAANERARQMRFLVQRGFTPEQARRALADR